MSAKKPQTFAKRARELAVKEKRDLKRARKAEAAAQRAAGTGEVVVDDQYATEASPLPVDGDQAGVDANP
jgi:hypothetical protein